MICNDTQGELRVEETEFMFCDLYVSLKSTCSREINSLTFEQTLVK